MPPSNPFDFSDFGGRPQAPPTGPPSGGFGPPSGGFGPPSSPSGFTLPPQAPQQQGPAGGFDPFFGQSGAPVGGEEAFGGPSAPMGPLTVSGPPIRLMAAALGIAVLGVLLGLVSVLLGSVLIALLGWLLAGPVAIGALAWFGAADTRRRTSSVYSAPAWLAKANWVVLGLSAIGIALSAWQIALWAGRL